MPAVSEVEVVDAEGPCKELGHESAQRKRVEYWSKTYRTWIPAEITAVDHDTCAVQVNVKPGVWLSSSDWDKKLRVAVYLCTEKSGDENNLDIAQRGYDRIIEPAVHEEVSSEVINETSFNEISPNRPLDDISRLHSHEIIKDHASRLLRPHDAANIAPPHDISLKPVSAPSPLDITRPFSAAAAWDDDGAEQIDHSLIVSDMPVVTESFTPAADAAATSGVIHEAPGLETAIPCVELLQEGQVDMQEVGHAPEVANPPECTSDVGSVWRPCSSPAAIPPVAYITATPVTASNSGISSEGRFAGYRCPNCGEGGLESIQEALDHCRKPDAQGKQLSRAGTTVTEETSSPSGAKGPVTIVSGTLSFAGRDDPATKGPEQPLEVQTAGPDSDGLCSTGNQAAAGFEEVGSSSNEHLPAPADSQSGSEPSIAAQADETGMVNSVPTATPDLQQEAPPRQQTDPLDANYQKPKTRILGYCCPKCGQGELATLQEAVQHCRKPEESVPIVRESFEDDGAAGFGVNEALPSAGLPCSAVPCASLPEARAPVMAALPGEPVAYNDYGQPVIARQVGEDGSRTMVLNDDGSFDVFGKQTIASLMSSSESEADAWVQVLNDYQLRGLVHEMGQRLLESSQVYQARLSQWESIGEKANLAFFGLSAGATDRELDVAYRQLSKKMHPDKNGGTEESKQRFQDMKTRYEALKKKRSENDEQGNNKQDEEQNAKGDDEEDSKDKDDRTIEFDPTSRESLNETCKKMLSQLSTLDSSMATLVKQLQRHGL
jgi:predicted RNA-binding Zn-ribbon protein involved in translation (DUF1610 family)